MREVAIRSKIRKLAKSDPKPKLCCGVSKTIVSPGYIANTFTRHAIFKLITLYGRYMDIVNCNPTGPRFRDRQGHITSKATQHGVFYFET